MTALPDLTVAVFGLGEAGSWISRDLADAGAVVRGYDPADVDEVAGVDRVSEPALAVAQADLVMGITAAADAMDALTQALDAIPAGSVYADLATASAAQKRRLADVAEARALPFADVALMSTVPGKGLGTPSLVSGSGAERYVELLAPASPPLTAVGADPGLAATRKLLRSVVLKGLAGLIIESMQAADAADLGPETWENLVEQFSTMDESFLRRIVSGTDRHAGRRLHEMAATAELLEELGVDPLMTQGTIESLRRVQAEGVPDLPA